MYLNTHRKEALPEDFSLDNGHTSVWKTDLERKIILLNDMQDIRQLLVLLHEIGHAADTEQRDLDSDAVLHGEAARETKDPDKKREHLEKSSMAFAKRERRAWAYATKRLRIIAETADFDVKEIFPTFEDLRDYIHTYLESYRRDQETASFDSLLLRDPKFLDDIEHAFHGAGPRK